VKRPQGAELPGEIANAQRYAGHSREASTAFSEACTAFLRISANAFEHFRRAALRSAPSSSRCQRDMSLRIRSHCISARRTLRCRCNGLSRCFAVMSQFEFLLPTKRSFTIAASWPLLTRRRGRARPRFFRSAETSLIVHTIYVIVTW
jgi:hypothetical protein